MESQSVTPAGRPAKMQPSRPKRTDDSKLLKSIGSELRKEAQKAANSIREIPDDMEAIRLTLREAGCNTHDAYDREWKVVRTGFVANSGEVRGLAGRGYLQIRDVLKLRDFLSSKAGFVAKQTEIESSINLLKDLKSDATGAVSRFTESCAKIDRLASDCLCCTKCSSRIQSKLQEVQRKVRQLIELEICLDRKVKAIVDQQTVGIVRSLIDFVLPGTRKDILASIGRRDASSLRTVSNTGSNNVKKTINVVAALIGVGSMLLEDFEDIQAQYKRAERTDLATYARYFPFVLDLYECFEHVLTRFQGECIKAGSGKDTASQGNDKSFLGRLGMFLRKLF